MLDNGAARRANMTKSMVAAGDNIADIVEVGNGDNFTFNSYAQNKYYLYSYSRP